MHFQHGACAVLCITFGCRLRAPLSVVTLTFLNHCNVEEITGNFTMYLINCIIQLSKSHIYGYILFFDTQRIGNYLF